VTSFGVFLKSPYNFFVSSVLRLEDLGLAGPELGPPKFGTLIHEALHLLAMDDAARDESSAERIAAFLTHALEARADQWFREGFPLPFPAQLAQAKKRLRTFAAWQAQRRADGWRIVAGEWKPQRQVALTVDGVPMPLTGRIDRIDRHPEFGYALLDYKTGATAADPKSAHLRTDGTWLDLQLPLYRHLASEVIGAELPAFGYVNLAADPACIGLSLAEFSNDELRAANLAAQGVVRRVRAGDFFEPGPKPPEDGVVASIIRGLALPGQDDTQAEDAT
jgi:ATP-dependent helicase/nuclease subunit B